MLFFEKENGNQSKVIMTKPYKETYLGKNEFLREFEPNTPSNELEWHLDEEDRIVEVLENKGNWQFQLDNKLPTLLENKIFIPKETYHRVIKGNDKLIVKIKKLPKQKVNV